MIYDPFTASKCDTSTLLEKLEAISSQIDNIQPPTTSTISFELLNINPTYSINPTSGWSTTPTDLDNICNVNNTGSATNLFMPPGGQWSEGDIIINSQVAIPLITRVQLKVGLRNINAGRAVFSFSAFDTSQNKYVSIWDYYGFAPNNTDLIDYIDIIVPFVWNKLRFKLIDIGYYQPQARIYNALKVYQVKCS